MMRRIDSHMHFWTLAMEQHYSLWMTPDLKVLYGDYGPRDARPLMDENDVEGAVLVSAASHVDETAYLLGIADTNDFVRGVVAWIDMLGSNAAQDLHRWARFRKLKGIRPYLQDLPEDDWILKPELEPAIAAMIECDLSFDALIKPRHILNTVKFIERNPDLRVIVDHMAKPTIRDNAFDPWRRDMEFFRDLKHVHCKVSGILTEDGPDWTPARISPYLEAVFDIFGPDRLVFGSDWPVVTLVADYGAWIKTLSASLSGLTRADQQKIWAENAARFYRL